MRRGVRARPLALALTLLLSNGCAARARSLAADLPRTAVPATIDETLKAGEDAPTRDRVAQILATPEMHRAIEDVAKTAVVGALDGLNDEESKERIAALTSELTKAFADGIRRELSRGDRVALEGAVASLAAAGTRGALRSAADEIPTTVAPAVRQALVTQLADPELRDAVSGMVGHTATRAVASTGEAVAEATATNKAEGRDGILAQLKRTVTRSLLLAVALGVCAAAVLAWGLRMRRRSKRYKELAIAHALTKANADEPAEARLQRLIELLS
jgi:hypothetical protein